MDREQMWLLPPSLDELGSHSLFWMDGAADVAETSPGYTPFQTKPDAPPADGSLSGG